MRVLEGIIWNGTQRKTCLYAEPIVFSLTASSHNVQPSPPNVFSNPATLELSTSLKSLGSSLIFPAAFFVRKDLPQAIECITKIKRKRERQNPLILHVWILKCGDVDSRIALYIDHPLRQGFLDFSDILVEHGRDPSLGETSLFLHNPTPVS